MSGSNFRNIARNTLLLYFRMGLLLILSLFTSRLIFATLGIVDYGLFNVISSLIMMFSFVNGTMSLSSQRYFSADIGTGGNNLKVLFSTSLLLQVLLAGLILILAETVGLWFLYNKLNIPVERESAAFWVFQIIVLSSFISVIQVPYISLIIAHERIDVFAYISIVEGVVRLLIVYLLLFVDQDRLVFYSFLGFVSSLVLFLVYHFYCRYNFPESRFIFKYDKNTVKTLSTFAGWNLLTEGAWAATNHGINIILNLFFGPAINAARAVAFQVNTAIIKFVLNFQLAMTPQIIKNYASDNIDEVKLLFVRGTNYSVYLLFLLILPIFIEMDFIIKLWLVNVPPYTILFCRLILLNAIIDIISNLVPTVIQATGSIKHFQIWMSLVLFLNFPISYLLLNYGMPPYVVLIVYGVVSIILLMIRAYFVKHMMRITYRDLIVNCIFPISKVIIVSVVPPVVVYLALNEGIMRLIAITLVSIISVLITIYNLGLGVKERGQLKGLIIRNFRKRDAL